MRLVSYAALSVLSMLSAIGYSIATRSQFYSIVVYLVTSKICIVILGNAAFVFTMLIGRVTKSLFLGRLRDNEVEVMWENSRYAITETCLALTIFREELSLRVVVMFTILLFAKIFHWLCDARVEHIEQAHDTSRLSHFRIVSLLATLFSIDVGFAAISAYISAKSGPSVHFLFGFEYVVLSIAVATTFVRYGLSVADIHFVQGRWHNKSLYELYLKLITDALQLLVYVVFFAIIFTYYGVPLHLLRQLYVSFKNLHERVQHFVQFRRITHSLYNRFANAVEEDFENSDRVCIICREEMQVGQGVGAPKKLPCGHIFHFYCLRNWLERQLSCPTCRADVLNTASAANAANGIRADVAQQRMNEQAARVAEAEHDDQPGTPDPPQTPNLNAAQTPTNREGLRDRRSPREAASASMQSHEIKASSQDDEEVRKLLLAAAAADASNSSLGTSTDRTQPNTAAENPPGHLLNSSPIGNESRASMPYVPFDNASLLASHGCYPMLHMTPEQQREQHLMVERTLQQQIEILTLQLQVYRAQVDAANATRAVVEAQQHAKPNV